MDACLFAQRGQLTRSLPKTPRTAQAAFLRCLILIAGKANVNMLKSVRVSSSRQHTDREITALQGTHQKALPSIGFYDITGENPAYAKDSPENVRVGFRVPYISTDFAP